MILAKLPLEKAFSVLEYWEDNEHIVAFKIKPGDVAPLVVGDKIQLVDDSRFISYTVVVKELINLKGLGSLFPIWVYFKCVVIKV